MAQSTILASGTTAASSTDIVVAAGDVVTVGIFSASSGDLLSSALAVQQVTPGALLTIGQLDSFTRSVQISGPGTFKVARPVLTTAFGVFKDA